MSGPVIYFIRSTHGGPVKIGRTRNLERRLGALQCGIADPVVVMRTVPGFAKVERWFHKHFAAHQVSREWFTFHPDMMHIECPAELASEDLAGSDLAAPFVTEESVAKLVSSALRRVVGDRTITAASREIGEKVGVSPRTVENYISGLHSPNGAQLVMLMAAYPEIASAIMGPMCQEHFARMVRAMDAIEVAQRELRKRIEYYGLPVPGGDEDES